MNSKLFTKKSFWAKLPIKQKVGIVAMITALLGWGTVYVLSQSDTSLQTKASLACDEACATACARITDRTQSASCRTSCASSRCSGQVTTPAVCTAMQRYVNLEQRSGGLNTYQRRVAENIVRRNKESIDSKKDLTSWYRERCSPGFDYSPPPASATPHPTSGPVSACTADAMICPDGSSVGRIAPSCYFAPCPPRPTQTVQTGP
ncbi:hypothetical protein A3B57_03120 [Microgenomates group bacterium RIFCSPLOWO2_01_FULL_47_10]|nr:MAG: hypothetical protein A3B57_03120 [Microgenomates group bacterium RIFCSPLOWO2_01_FULL_47_10]